MFRVDEVVMTMKMLVCTAGAVDDAFMGVIAAEARFAAQAAVRNPLPSLRSRSTGGVRLYEAAATGRGAQWPASEHAKTSIDYTTFPTRLGPPPDSPPVN